MKADELCLTAGQAGELGNWATSVFLWSLEAYKTCALLTANEAVDAMMAGEL